MNRTSWIYIVASLHWTLYTGVTTDLENRAWKHKTKAFAGFASRYNCDRLVYFEEFGDVRDAISREKQIKGWRRSKKLALIKGTNPELLDLAAEWFSAEAIEAATTINVGLRAEARNADERT